MLRRVVCLLDPAAAPASGAPPIPPAEPNPAPAAEPEPGDPPAEPEPEPEPPAEPPAPEPEPPVDGKDDPLLKSLLADMAPDIKPVPETPAEPPADPAAPPATPPAEPVSPAAPAAKKKKRVSIVDKIDLTPEPPSRAVAPPAPSAPSAPAAVPPVDADAQYVQGLTDEQKEELAEAEYAERMFPERYKGRRQKLIDWYKQLDATAQRLASEAPEKPLDENNEEWSRFARTKPKMDGAHAKQILRTMAKEEAQRDVQSTIDPQISELQRKQREIEFQPKLEKTMTQLGEAMDEFITSDEQSPLGTALKAIKERPTEATKEFALEKKIIDSEKQRSADLTREFIKFSSGLAVYSEKNQTHQELLRFINEQGQAMMQQPEAVRVQNGKSFLPRAEYNEAVRSDPTAKARHWTFSQKDIIEMIGMQAKVNMESRYKAKLKENEELGFERRKPGNSAQPPKTPPGSGTNTEPKPIVKPKASPTLARGAARPIPPAQADNGIDVVSTLGLRK